MSPQPGTMHWGRAFFRRRRRELGFPSLALVGAVALGSLALIGLLFGRRST